MVGAMTVSPEAAAFAEPIRIGIAVRAAIIIIPGVIPGVIIPGP